MSAEQDVIKDRAYQLWQDAGSPDGRDQEFWFLAESELKAPKPKTAAKPKAAAPAKAPAKAKALAKPKVAAKAKA